MCSYVYLITHRDSGKVYVGKANDPQRRWLDHLAAGLKGDRRPLYAALRKHGVEAFDFCVIEHHDSEDAAYLSEKYWITRLKEFEVPVYNLNDGGEGQSRGYHASAETRQKLSAALKGRTGKSPSPETRAKLSAAFKGKPGKSHSAESRAKISASRRGKPLSSEAKAKLSAWQKGRKLSPEHASALRTAAQSPAARAKAAMSRRGKTRSEETRKKISLSSKGKVLSEEHRTNLRVARNSRTKRERFLKAHQEWLSVYSASPSGRIKV